MPGMAGTPTLGQETGKKVDAPARVGGVKHSGSRSCRRHAASGYLFFSLPRGATVVTGGMGRSEGMPPLFGAEVSFFGFLDIFSLRCSLPINSPDAAST